MARGLAAYADLFPKSIAMEYARKTVHNLFIPALDRKCLSYVIETFRLSYDPVQYLENNAQEFVNQPFSLNFFPHGEGDVAKNMLQLDNSVISLSAFYAEGDNYTLRLVNTTQQNTTVNVTLCQKDYALSFEPYEVKTLLYDGQTLNEKEVWL